MAAARAPAEADIAGLWAEVEEDRERLLVEFEVLGEPEATLPWGEPIMFKGRDTLPPRMLDDRLDPEPLCETGTQTFLYIPLSHGVPIPPLRVEIGAQR